MYSVSKTDKNDVVCWEVIMSAATFNNGDPAPDFELTSDEGKKVKLSHYRGKKVILYFYPRDDTPGCTTQACGFRDRYPDIVEKDAVVLGVSPDDAESHKKFKTKHNLPFLLLVDSGHKVAEQYGVWGEKKLAGVEYRGITRSHFVIDENGLFADVQMNVSPVDSVRKALDNIGIKP
jgi:thioredoxin-dependent peroxiredoxin